MLKINSYFKVVIINSEIVIENSSHEGMYISTSEISVSAWVLEHYLNAFNVYSVVFSFNIMSSFLKSL